MKKVLIVGNCTKDVYLRLDPQNTALETDADHVGWLDLAFDGSSHDYFSRVAVFGGASISLEVCRRFGLDASVMGSSVSFQDGQLTPPARSECVYRYIVCYDQQVSYFSPSNFPDNVWQTPAETPDWIYIDRSAKLSEQFAREALKYLEAHSDCQLAMFIGSRSNANANFLQALIQRAQLIITDTELAQQFTPQLTIDAGHIQSADEQLAWSLQDKDHFLTHLSAHLIIATSYFSAMVLEKSPHQAMLLAKANVENAKLSGTANLNHLEELLAENNYTTTAPTPEYVETAQRLVAKPKGILAADESGGSIHKKFETLNIPDDAQHRRDYRNIFFTTPELAKYVNGVILFDETARQSADDGQNFVKFLANQGIIPGIKVDQGLENFPDSAEKYTKGLEGLPERLAEYYQMGARFAKWRSAFEMNQELRPSEMAIQKNAEILADYAKACQANNITPIVEPELVYDGYYDLKQSALYTGKILDALFEALRQKDVDLRGTILKVNMVIAGKQFETQSKPEEVGQATAETLRQHVPKELAGVVFLSGGQNVEQATANLQAITNQGPFPWPVTFSFARALQDPALQAWQGNNQNTDSARQAFHDRLVANCQALRKQ